MSNRDTAGAARTYDRVASVYDLYSRPMEWMGGAARRRRMLRAATGRTLEAGVGTGLNLEHYPTDVQVTAIDISPRMVDRARARGDRLGADVVVEVADVERLPYPDDHFDTATATCVFCSVPDPVRGMEELGRVVRKDGRVLLLEHVRPRNPILGFLADLVTPLTRRVLGPDVNRDTERNVEAAGLDIMSVRRDGVWREIEARPGSQGMDRGT